MNEETQEKIVLVNYRGTNVYNINNRANENVTFVPGINKVREYDLEFFKLHRYFKKDLEEGLFFIVEGDVKAVAQRKNAGNSLNSLDDDSDATDLVPVDTASLDQFSKAEDAVRVIENTNDLDLLKEWNAKEKRKLLQIAIRKRIKFIEDELLRREVAKSDRAIGKQPPQSGDGD